MSRVVVPVLVVLLLATLIFSVSYDKRPNQPKIPEISISHFYTGPDNIHYVVVQSGEDMAVVNYTADSISLADNRWFNKEESRYSFKEDTNNASSPRSTTNPRSP